MHRKSIFIIILIVSVGCSGGSDPISPTLDTTSSSHDLMASNVVLWGL